MWRVSGRRIRRCGRYKKDQKREKEREVRQTFNQIRKEKCGSINNDEVCTRQRKREK